MGYLSHICADNSYGNPNMTKLSNSNIASAKVQRSNYPNIKSAKGQNQILQVLLTFDIFALGFRPLLFDSFDMFGLP